jgi:hypothetical protein
MTSTAGYALRDAQGLLIGVDPGGTDPDGVEQSVDHFEPHSGGGRSLELFGLRVPDFLTNSADPTLGYEYREWILRPGATLYILGEVHDRVGPLVIGKPEGEGHFIVSSRSEQELRRSRATKHKIIAGCVLIAFFGGLALLVAGILA